ncbi:glycosyltransferase family 2 protein [Aestuariibaculum sediminum]|uniref:Glycosyltransferase family 2 protein n=1 Tax=Aestuariibaculum sediminum TaxID=2770637 RepID=A0A8J6Q8A3_9FLAO|nr:glycosyltransferase family A protein [Aestuariibaculum sediminum]MBD0833103.1 glycosyltransferase family 2 protein [Aestuariibaculum sediminum]
MILLVHKHNKLLNATDLNSGKSLNICQKTIIKSMFEVAKLHPETQLIWCDYRLTEVLSVSAIKSRFHLKNLMFSYGPSPYFSEHIGYIEDSPFLKVNPEVVYPTWFMSSAVGGIYGSNLLKFESVINENHSFDFNLNTIAKSGMKQGLFCYSVPDLIQLPWPEHYALPKASISELFRFVKMHYKTRWSALLLFNMAIYENRIPFLAFIKSIFYKKVNFTEKIVLEALVDSDKLSPFSLDIIIPTIGRKTFVYDALCDLRQQTYLPKKVVIVEQNPDIESESELDFLLTEAWPFEVKHIFTHKTGACYSRNLALKEVTSEWVFLADDDNRFTSDLLDTIKETINKFQLKGITFSYLQKNEIESQKLPIQWHTFGAGSSVISSQYLKNVKFNEALEFGYGEDVDFGMQLRNQGVDIIYMPQIKVLHLKAPIGGFRMKFEHPWENDNVKPKPSPTVMLNRILNTTRQQILGYKTTLFFKYYKQQHIKNPFKYYLNFKKEWNRSEYWAKQLKTKA